MIKFKDQFDFDIELTFDEANFSTPTDVVVYPFYRGKLVFTAHKKRGIELPGGKIKENECPIDAACREVLEECGAVLQNLKLIGQYSIPHLGIVKAIYTASVRELLDIPFITDTDGPVLFDSLPIQIYDSDLFSPYMKDAVYPTVLKYLQLK
jgi:8-oxo-dGTP diphosphatase